MTLVRRHAAVLPVSFSADVEGRRPSVPERRRRPRGMALARPTPTDDGLCNVSRQYPVRDDPDEVDNLYPEHTD